MPKFKIGDRVKLISKEPKWHFGPYVRTGDVGYVRFLDSTRGTELHVDFPKHKLWCGMESEFVLASKSTTTTKKPKEPKTMQTTKKPETSHGKSLRAPAKAPEAKAAVVPYRPTVGDVVRITKDTCNHRFPINSVFTIKKDDKSDLPYYPGDKKNPNGNWFAPGDCELITKSADVVKASKEAKATVKPKYPVARVQRELIAEAKPLEKRTKAELIKTAQDLAVQFHNLAADHCIAGTKLDRALVDLKEAKAKIKELAKGTEATK